MSTAGETAIALDAVSKAYRIWQTPAQRLLSPIGRRLGRIVPGSAGAALRKRAVASYREFFAVQNVSFTLPRGDSLALIGRNGSGKSTLLQIIAGTLRPTSGRVTVNGRVAALLELGSGFNDEFTGRENAFLYGSIFGVTRAEMQRRMPEIEAFAEIGSFIEQPVKTYSSGMKLRLAFSVIAHLDPEVLVIDEALAVGDYVFVQKCMRLLRDFVGRGTLLLATHDLSAVRVFCRNALWLEQGHVRAYGRASDVVDDYIAECNRVQAAAAAAAGGDAASPARVSPNGQIRHDLAVGTEVRDQRLAFLNQTKLRNEIAVIDWIALSKTHGSGKARIERVQLLDRERFPLGGVIGGEVVHIAVDARAVEDIDRAIIGFNVKDQLGQYLFGDNTYLTMRDQPLTMARGERVRALFKFQMPILPPGRYAVCAAISSGTQDNHVQHHWVHEALIFESTSQNLHGGIVSIPMMDIRIGHVDS